MHFAIGEHQCHVGRKPDHEQRMNVSRTFAEPTDGRTDDAGDDPRETLGQTAMQTWLDAIRSDVGITADSR